MIMYKRMWCEKCKRNTIHVWKKGKYICTHGEI